MRDPGYRSGAQREPALGKGDTSLVQSGQLSTDLLPTNEHEGKEGEREGVWKKKVVMF